MKTFNSLEEMEPYYNEKTNAYEFSKDGVWMDVKFAFDLSVEADINAYNIDAGEITARNINACNIDAGEITARNINADNIKAWNINANKITYFAVCFAYNNIVCTKIEGTRKNAKHFCLDGEIIIKDKPIEGRDKR
jgi:hypothetical protein